MTVPVLVLVVSVVAAIAVGCGVGILIRKNIGEKKIGSAEQEAKRIVEEGKKNAEAKMKELLLEGKEEVLRLRNETERDLKERRTEISRQERRIVQKEENLDKKTEALERKNEQLDEKLKANDIVKEQIQMVLTQHLSRLEEISGYTAEEAKAELMSRVESEAKHDLAQKLDELEAQFKEEADSKARNLLSLAIQRCAADHVTEATVSAVALPNEEMKGRIIGRE